MGRLFLALRLAAKDIRRHPAEALLLFVAIAAATTTLTVALALHGVTSAPYAATRAATAGPDVVAAVQESGRPPARLTALRHAPGVADSSGPYLIAAPNLVVDGHSDPVMAEGRDPAACSVDQPKLTAGHWVTNGGVVVERSLADLLGLKVGDRVGLDNLVGGGNGLGGGPAPGPAGGPGEGNGGPIRAVGPSFTVVGIAVTATLQPPPLSEFAHPSGFPEAGLVWVTRSAAEHLASSDGGGFGYTLNLTLSHPSGAPAFADAHQQPGLFLISWQAIAAKDGLIVSIEQAILLTGSTLLGLLAMASVALLVGGRMEQQTRRVGLLKAVGASPALVTGVLLAEQLVLSLVAAAFGLVIGWLAAPSPDQPWREPHGCARCARPHFLDHRDRARRRNCRGLGGNARAGCPGLSDQHRQCAR